MIESERVPGADSLYADLDGTRVHYLRAGEAPRASDASADRAPVICCHGSGIDDAALSWRHVVPALAESRRVYALDWPGYGDSDAPADEPTVEYFADVLEAFLDDLPVERPVLLGLSMGAAAAIGVALRDPSRVRGLALVSSYGLRDAVPGGASAYLLANTPFAASVGRHLAGVAPGAARAAIAPFVADTGSLDDGFVSAVRERLARSDAGDAWMAFQRSEFGPTGVRTHYADRLDDLDVPVLFVHGDADPLIPLSWVEAAAERVPDAELAVMDECGHWPPRECPATFQDVLEEWLDGL